MSNNAQLELMKSIRSITMPSNILPKEANIRNVGATATQPDYPINSTVKKMKPRLCTQCGAPLHSNKCRFCDTEYC